MRNALLGCFGVRGIPFHKSAPRRFKISQKGGHLFWPPHPKQPGRGELQNYFGQGCLENDYRKELWNGSVGIIESVLSSNGKRALLCSLDGTRHEIPEEEFQRLDLAYAITVHKAQGSQFKRVIVPVVRSRLLDRTLIYTALTRGVEQVVFIGDRAAFDAAVIAPPRSRRRFPD
jgi:exodeoxyribonuclease V alpha subunit